MHRAALAGELLALEQGSLVEIFAIGLAVFPATKENTNPLESQSPDDRISGLALSTLLLVVGFGPGRGADRGLGTDHIDLYQIHRPDENTPIEETLQALNEMVRAGKVREIGCSNFSAGQIRAADSAAPRGTARFLSVQNEYSLIHREPEQDVLLECSRRGLVFLPYFPMANGLLTGKYRLGQPFPVGSRAQTGWGPKVFTEGNLALVESLTDFAESRGHTLLELAFSWLLSRPVVVSVIAGATSPDQIRTNATAAAWELAEDDLAAIDSVLAVHGKTSGVSRFS